MPRRLYRRRGHGRVHRNGTLVDQPGRAEDPDPPAVAVTDALGDAEHAHGHQRVDVMLVLPVAREHQHVVVAGRRGHARDRLALTVGELDLETAGVARLLPVRQLNHGSPPQ